MFITAKTGRICALCLWQSQSSIFFANRSKALLPQIKKTGQFQFSTAAARRPVVGVGTGKDVRIKVDLNDVAEEAVVKNNVKPKNHPGVFRILKVELPERFTAAAQIILSHENVKEIEASSNELKEYLWNREIPAEEDELREKAKLVEEQFLDYDNVLEPFLSQKEILNMENNRFMKVKKKLQSLIYHWKPIEYTHRRALEYLISRTAGEYAALRRILHEISVRDPTFKPQSLCDFGSGIGSSLWAANSYWSETIQEYLAVDISRDMNDIAELILRGGNPENEHWLPGVFFRQFLPSASKIKYDLVLSSYSLLELPTAKVRLETVDILWKKTAKYLVFVEAGTNAGFEVLNDVREYILGLHRKTPSREVHMFSPCPNDTWCPRFNDDVTPCNFTIPYRKLLPFKRNFTSTEKFSYLVFKRGQRSLSDEQWPRVVRDPLIRHRHLVCRLCTKHGKLSEVVLTKGKSSQALFQCGKKSHCGDLFPVEEVNDTDGTSLGEPESDQKF